MGSTLSQSHAVNFNTEVMQGAELMGNFLGLRELELRSTARLL